MSMNQVFSRAAAYLAATFAVGVVPAIAFGQSTPTDPTPNPTAITALAMRGEAEKPSAVFKIGVLDDRQFIANMDNMKKSLPQDASEADIAKYLQSVQQGDLIYFLKAAHNMNLPMYKWMIAHHCSNPVRDKYDYPYFGKPEKDPEYQAWVQTQRGDSKMISAILAVNYYYGPELQETGGNELITTHDKLPTMMNTANAWRMIQPATDYPLGDVIGWAESNAKGYFANGATKEAVNSAYKAAQESRVNMFDYMKLLSTIFPKDITQNNQFGARPENKL